ncbi:MAG TPA: four helix bundle protein [Vicinamibacterales bacterium]|nr:four helix bundle protein [Vicinamibacterales bacterium]
MSDINSYRDLVCWQKAIDLVLLVYEITDKYPPNERFGLASHTRRSAVSVPSNIAEGTRHKTAGYISRLVIALGEHAELETQLIIADRLGYIRQSDKERMESLSASVGQLTHGLLRSLERGSHGRAD